MTVDPQRGDWVLIRARVTRRPTPENVEVELFSATDQFFATVRADLCEITAKPIPDEPAVGSVALLDGDAYQRIENRWYAANSGMVSGWTWTELHEIGDVEVIHHG